MIKGRMEARQRHTGETGECHWFYSSGSIHRYLLSRTDSFKKLARQCERNQQAIGAFEVMLQSAPEVFMSQCPIALVAILPLFSAFTGLCIAQPTPLTCTINAAVPPVVRVDGLAELTGHVVVICVGGTPTPAGTAIPSTNLQVFLNTSISSRILLNGWSEALLAIDEPVESAQRVCGTAGDVQTQTGVCAIKGTGNGANVYDGSVGRPNIFQGQIAGTNSIVWAGVPIDPPGNSGTRILRLMNVRADASAIGPPGPNQPPTHVVAVFTSSGTAPLPITGPHQQVVGFINVNVTSSVTTPLQCLGTFGGKAVAKTTIQIHEGFATAFKVRTTAPFIDNNTSPPPANGAATDGHFDTETGFFNSAFPTFPARGNLARAGLADEGTRLFVRFSNVPTGIVLFAPAVIHPTNSMTVARRVLTGINGGGPFNAAPASASGLSQFSNFSGTAEAFYEILEANPNVIETLTIPVFVVDVGGVGLKTLTNSSVTAGFAPLSQIGTASTTAPLPRFANPTTVPVVLPTPNCP